MLGIALLAFAGAASATTVDLSASPTGPSLNPGDQGLVPTTSVQGSFTDNWYFSLSQTSNVGLAITSINLSIAPGLNTSISNLVAELVDNSTGNTVVVNGATSYSGLSLANGNYDLIISGNADGTLGGIYAGAVAVQAVPLPAAAWLLLSGLASMGALARRRRSA
jgi:hypothetical protein